MSESPFSIRPGRTLIIETVSERAERMNAALHSQWGDMFAQRSEICQAAWEREEKAGIKVGKYLQFGGGASSALGHTNVPIASFQLLISLLT